MGNKQEESSTAGSEGVGIQRQLPDVGYRFDGRT
jgi:hypothetical protein